MTHPKEPSTNYLVFNREIDVLQPESFVPNLDDVFRALPKINRFNGQTTRPYSVALHSLYCVEQALLEYGIVNPDYLLAIQFHDAGEAYIGDIVRPIKQHFNGSLYTVEDQILQRIYALLHFSNESKKEMKRPWFNKMVREIDTRMAVTEADLLTEMKIMPEIPRFNISELKCSQYELDETAFRQAYYSLIERKAQQ